MPNLNFIFWGTPDVAKETLDILKQNGLMPSLIITSPDARAGRKMILTPPPVKIWAIENNIPYLQPEKLDEEFINELKPSCLEPSCLFLVVAYGKIIPKEILEIPKLGSINIHYSLLPKYRGASPVESAILHGDTETGVSIQKMIYKMDAGDILAQEKTNILSDETTPELRIRLIQLGGELLVKTLPEYIENKITPISQDENLVTICKKINKEDGQINLNDDGVKNYNKYRAYAKWPRTFFFRYLPASRQERVIITKAHLENGNFIIDKIIPEGKKEVGYSTIL